MRGQPYRHCGYGRAADGNSSFYFYLERLFQRRRVSERS